MTSATVKSIIAIAAAASIALFAAVSTAEAGKGSKGGAFKGSGVRISSHAARGAKVHAGPKFHSGSKAIRYSGGKIKISNYGKPNYAYSKKGHGKPYYSYSKKGHGKYKPYQHYGKYPYYRRYAHYAWYGVPLYSYGGGCGWLYRQAVSTGSDYWWDRYYRCARYSY